MALISEHETAGSLLSRFDGYVDISQVKEISGTSYEIIQIIDAEYFVGISSQINFTLLGAEIDDDDVNYLRSKTTGNIVITS